MAWYSNGGVLRFALEIEGWPQVFVSDAAITYTSGLDGRTVLPSLLTDDLQLSDRSLMAEGRCESSSITFKLRPHKGTVGGTAVGTDPLMATFSLYPQHVAQLQTDLTSSGTTLDIVAAGGLSNNTYYHIGTETIKVTTWPTIQRDKWSTQPQAHRVSYADGTHPVLVYATPVTAEGRRVFLRAYGPTDSMTGVGTIIWRGVIQRHPELDQRDGVTWLLEAHGVTHHLRQKVGGGEVAHLAPYIYHSGECPVAIKIKYGSTWGTVKYHVGIDTPDTLCQNVNTLFATELTALSMTAIDSIRLEQSPGGGFFLNVKTDTTPTVPDLLVFFGSPIIGFFLYGDLWEPDDGGTPVRGAPGAGSILDNDDEYAGHLTYDRAIKNKFDLYTYAGPPVSPLGDGVDLMTGSNRYNYAEMWSGVSTANRTAFPKNRIFVDQDLATADYVSITGLGLFLVTNTGTDTAEDGRVVNFIDVVIGPVHSQALPCHMLTIETEITPLGLYGEGNVGDFVQGLFDKSVEANEGVAPFITNSDMVDIAAGAPTINDVPETRRYAFSRAKTVEDVFAEELKFCSHFPRIELDGRIGVKPYPNFTGASIVTSAYVLTTAATVSPADGYGKWPDWRPQRDGVVTTVTVQDFYNAVSDDWDGSPRTVNNENLIATHKNRGAQKKEIKPFSASTLPPDSEALLTQQLDAATAMLDYFGRDYAVVRIQVPLPYFFIICGDVVNLTHPLIPNGDGTRGLSAVPGVVVERRWNLNPPSGQAPGELSIWIPREVERGYAPSAIITAQVNTSGNNWNLTCDTTATLNTLFSQTGDGRCLEHFQASDRIEIRQRDAFAPTVVTGTITGTPNAAAGTCAVALDSAWTPGASAWVLNFRSPDASPTTHQNEFVYVADTSQVTPDGQAARKFG